MTSLRPIQIFGDDAEEERGENAQLSSFVGAIAICDMIKTTLGPRGMVYIYIFMHFL